MEKFTKIARRQICEVLSHNNIDYNKNGSFENILHSYINFLNKTIPIVNRTVFISDVLIKKITNKTIKDPTLKNLRFIEDCFKKGKNMNGYLSKGIYASYIQDGLIEKIKKLKKEIQYLSENKKNKSDRYNRCKKKQKINLYRKQYNYDKLLNDLNIRHLHISDKVAHNKAGMSKNRSRDLLFFLIEDDKVYFIDVGSHKTFCEHSLVEITYTNWPHVYNDRVIPNSKFRYGNLNIPDARKIINLLYTKSEKM